MKSHAVALCAKYKRLVIASQKFVVKGNERSHTVNQFLHDAFVGYTTLPVSDKAIYLNVCRVVRVSVRIDTSRETDNYKLIHLIGCRRS